MNQFTLSRSGLVPFLLTGRCATIFQMPPHATSSLGYYPDAELIFGIVTPIGIDYHPVVTSLCNYLQQFGYSSREIKISSTFETAAEKLGINVDNDGAGQAWSMWRKIKLGDEICRVTQAEDALALLAAAMIENGRERLSPKENLPLPKTAHIIISLKRPQEVATLRRIYGTGFWLVGIAADDAEREKFFNERGFSDEERTAFIDADAAENGKDYGQQTRDTFYLSDVFIPQKESSINVERFLDLVFGNPFLTPTQDERSMYLAYAASLSSGDLARQVGAALVDDLGDCLGLGWNDVPKAHGGMYGPEKGSKRDIEREEDSNDTEKLEMAVAIMRTFEPEISIELARASARKKLKGTGFFDITEFGRAVHAEMAALLASARTGRSTRESTMYVTTFPCHTCTRHIIAAGVKAVYYIEPYTKSKAFKLHDDACKDGSDESAQDERIPFKPFIGIGPRRFLDLFSMSLGTGHPIVRKENGTKVAWKRSKAAPRLQMAPASYLEREQFASTTMQELLSAWNANPSESGEPNDHAKSESLGSDQ